MGKAAKSIVCFAVPSLSAIALVKAVINGLAPRSKIGDQIGRLEPSVRTFSMIATCSIPIWKHPIIAHALDISGKVWDTRFCKYASRVGRRPANLPDPARWFPEREMRPATWQLMGPKAAQASALLGSTNGGFLMAN